MIRRLMVPLTLAVLASLAASADRAGAQGAFPAPLPSQMNQPPANDPAFPPVANGGLFPKTCGRAARCMVISTFGIGMERSIASTTPFM